jgi:hypothetical protein
MSWDIVGMPGESWARAAIVKKSMKHINTDGIVETTPTRVFIGNASYPETSDLVIFGK